MVIKESDDFRHVNMIPKSVPKPKVPMDDGNKGYHPHREYDSLKHVSHNRNHTMPGVGRHS